MGSGLEGWFLVENSALGREEGSWVLQVVRLEGGGYAPASARLQADAPHHCRRLNPMWFLALCAHLEPSRSPLTTRHPLQPGCAGRSKKGAGWAAGPEMGPHKESFCPPLQLLLGAPSSPSGSLPALREQFALLGLQQRWPSCLPFPCPAAMAMGPDPLDCAPGCLLGSLG